MRRPGPTCAAAMLACIAAFPRASYADVEAPVANPPPSPSAAERDAPPTPAEREDPPASQQGPAAPLQPDATPDTGRDPTSASPMPEGWVPLPPELPPESPPEPEAGSEAPAHDPQSLRNAAEEGDPPDPCAGAITRTPPRAKEMWFDRVERRLRRSGCRSAYWIDGLFGRVADPAEYREVSGNVAPSMLWTQYDGFDARLRFRIDLPLPQIDERLRAFVGRVDRDEFVTERAEQSGALPRQFGTIGEEQTLLGLGYRGPTKPDGGGWDFGVGVRVRFPLDPYVKASYPMAWNFGEDTLLAFKPTLFWQQTEQFGFTTRFDLPHVFGDTWFGLLTLSTTWSELAQGVRGYANATLFHQLSQKSAMALQVGLDGETQADVPLREYGARATYRRNVWRDWLVLELRTSLTWPREKLDESRDSSWGAGVGFEMVFGPGTFRGN